MPKILDRLIELEDKYLEKGLSYEDQKEFLELNDKKTKFEEEQEE